MNQPLNLPMECCKSPKNSDHCIKCLAKPRDEAHEGSLLKNLFFFLVHVQHSAEWGKSQIKAAMKYLEDSSCLRFPAWSKTLYADDNLPHAAYLNYVNHGG